MAKFLEKLGIGRRQWSRENLAPSEEINQGRSVVFGNIISSSATLLGYGTTRPARSRNDIYNKWAQMEGDPIIHSALKILVTVALGGHETSGDLVFIEKKPDINPKTAPMVEEIAKQLTPLFNKVAFTVAYTGCAFGDAFARVYSDHSGVIDLHSNEMMHPMLVQAFERGSRTVGYAVSIGEKRFERLNVSQMARLKMPRVQWIPQHGVTEKSIIFRIDEDDVNAMPLTPSLVGGSMLYAAETAYDNYTSSIVGMVGQRLQDGIDEQIVIANMDSLTHEQQERFKESIKDMLRRSKDMAEAAVKTGRPVMERIRHILPVFGDKQMLSVANANGGQPGRAGNIMIEDIMMHARLLSGALGVDLSMLGFADQMAGGLGEGGFFRTSAQAAESARVIRVALEQFFNSVIDIHCFKRYGMVFHEADRPWEINFFGSISALEREKQAARMDQMNAGLILAQGIQTMKDLGADEAIMKEFLVGEMALDESRAEMFSKIVSMKKPEEQDGGF